MKDDENVKNGKTIAITRRTMMAAGPTHTDDRSPLAPYSGRAAQLNTFLKELGYG